MINKIIALRNKNTSYKELDETLDQRDNAKELKVKAERYDKITQYIYSNITGFDFGDSIHLTKIRTLLGDYDVIQCETKKK